MERERREKREKTRVSLEVWGRATRTLREVLVGKNEKQIEAKEGRKEVGGWMGEWGETSRR